MHTLANYPSIFHFDFAFSARSKCSVVIHLRVWLKYNCSHAQKTIADARQCIVIKCWTSRSHRQRFIPRHLRPSRAPTSGRATNFRVQPTSDVKHSFTSLSKCFKGHLLANIYLCGVAVHPNGKSHSPHIEAAAGTGRKYQLFKLWIPENNDRPWALFWILHRDFGSAVFQCSVVIRA